MAKPVRQGWRALVLCALMSACDAFYVDEGPTITPVLTLVDADTTAASARPGLDGLRQRLTRRTSIGIGGTVEATLLTPPLVRLMLAVEEPGEDGVGAREVHSPRASIWRGYFGNLDRFPIDLVWRFDQQFHASNRVLEPANWHVVLTTDRGDAVEPLAVSVLKADRLPVDGQWNGRVRLWFAFREPRQQAVLLGGDVRWARLMLTHRSGVGTLTWRMHSPF